eukprot:SM000062S19925  [mRNA]  locus=s62:409750:411988:+ [translate_table: standard]
MAPAAAPPGRPVQLHADLMSQPCRAVLLFCRRAPRPRPRLRCAGCAASALTAFAAHRACAPRLTCVPCELHLLRIAKGEAATASFRVQTATDALCHTSATYRPLLSPISALAPAINPLGKVPAIVDDQFRLSESHAIMRYLVQTRVSIPDHWFPTDATSRAKVDSVLDWHHSNLRRGCDYGVSRCPLSAGIVFNRVLAPSLGRPLNETAAAEAEMILRASLRTMDTVWLVGEAPFLAGQSRPSIADISLSCELMQVKLLGDDFHRGIVHATPNVEAWLQAVQSATSPHFEAVHQVLYKAAARLKEVQISSVERGSNHRQLLRNSRL